jgi:hypothetical protein
MWEGAQNRGQETLRCRARFVQLKIHLPWLEENSS